MQIIPSLISFEFGGDSSTGPGPNATWWGGRADVIRDPAARKVFLNTMLAELLAASTDFQKEIYAWELINEPIWLCVEFGPLSRQRWLPHEPETTILQMTSFLNESVAMVDKAGFQSTIGHRYYDDLRVFPTGSVSQFHYYADDRWYNFLGGAKNDPPMKGLFKGEHRPILGEFDSASNTSRKQWKYDQPKIDSTLERLRLLESERCDLALIWPDLSDNIKSVIDNDVIKFAVKTRAEIAAYTGGKPPPLNE